MLLRRSSANKDIWACVQRFLAPIDVLSLSLVNMEYYGSYYRRFQNFFKHCLQAYFSDMLCDYSGSSVVNAICHMLEKGKNVYLQSGTIVINILHGIPCHHKICVIQTYENVSFFEWALSVIKALGYQPDPLNAPKDATFLFLTGTKIHFQLINDDRRDVFPSFHCGKLRVKRSHVYRNVEICVADTKDKLDLVNDICQMNAHGLVVWCTFDSRGQLIGWEQYFAGDNDLEFPISLRMKKDAFTCSHEPLGSPRAPRREGRGPQSQGRCPRRPPDGFA